uniref:Uncharacterized protein LOC100378515 n=1 Tax=Saccoglossus kowalevskii TaxID=10224 RepID=A0ABM0M6J5_SACKO|nr:PREDICTED: uncharacterized protein LOC100378515 [Saccoglossus kowalevskii]
MSTQLQRPLPVNGPSTDLLQDYRSAHEEGITPMEEPPKEVIMKGDNPCDAIIGNFASSTTVHGLPHILSSTSLRAKLVWAAVCLVAICVFAYQSSELIHLYLRFEVRMKIETGTAESLSFPAVTICNTNTIRASEAVRSGFAEVVKTDPQHPESIHRKLIYKTPCMDEDFSCGDGTCIKSHLVCDGYFHCWDGLSDEVNCTYQKCGVNEFNCGQAGLYGVCIPEEQRCDGTYHCLEGEDEQNCPSCHGEQAHACDNSDGDSINRCIPLSSVCDHFPDCVDGSDERLCSYDDTGTSGGCSTSVTALPTTMSMLYSPGYPSDYPGDQQCTINVHSPVTYCTYIRFLEMDIAWSANCSDDFLALDDVMNTNISRKYCGHNTPTSWISSSDEVLLHFSSNSDGLAGRGYRLEYTAVPCQDDSMMTWETGPWEECSVTCGIGTRSRQVQCPVDSSSSLFECLIPGSIPPSEEVCNTQPCPDGLCGAVLEQCCAELTSPGYPDNYTVNLHCEIYIINSDGCVAINFIAMDIIDSEECHKDYLLIQDLDRPTHRQIYCGKSMERWNSVSGRVLMTFHSDSYMGAAGFKATYEFVPCGTWQVMAWSQCTASCGNGMRFRRVLCWSRSHNGEIDEKFCSDVKPITSEKCNDVTCDVVEVTEIPYTVKNLYERFKDLVDEFSVYQDFIDSYYTKNSFDGIMEYPPDWVGLLSRSTSPDYSDLQDMLKLSAEEVAKFGHQGEDFILRCTFDEKYCNSSQFSVFQNDNYGNCYTFNDEKLINGTIRRSSRPGARFGLKITLYLEQNEYIPIFGQTAGVRVLIHPPDVAPFPENNGITVPPGFKSSFAIRRLQSLVYQEVKMTEPRTNLQQLTKKRGANKAQLTRQLQKADDTSKKDKLEETDIELLQSTIENIEEQIKLVRDLDEQILDLVEEENYERLFTEADDSLNSASLDTSGF